MTEEKSTLRARQVLHVDGYGDVQPVLSGGTHTSHISCRHVDVLMHHPQSIFVMILQKVKLGMVFRF